MAAIFAGKQIGYPDPTLSHEPGIVEPWDGGTLTFAGIQAGQAAPTVSAVLRRGVGGDLSCVRPSDAW